MLILLSPSGSKGITKQILSKTIELAIDVSSNEADRVIERLKASRKLLEVNKLTSYPDSHGGPALLLTPY